MLIESISTGGALLVGPLTLDRGEQVQILFEIDDHPIDVVGEVVRSENHDVMTDRVAIKFINMNAETRMLVRELVRRTLELEECQRASEFNHGRTRDEEQ